ncbi:hypothetical protein IG193_04125 [Infirmifilum lucidum]|uniref:Uncharacterized protein n=1 Tax=Infirmifilum lucidum TaxID=2776706 RepID=A0A7L9FIQ6_9CREN|nr:hypothetical protein [Infirmifilum lucidum]QOJ79649.1 hypothetical protein IG193_04125 [Infirmifilum lucidum]
MMVFEKKIKLKALQVALEASLKRGLKKLRREDLRAIDERLAALAPLALSQLFLTPEEVASKIFQPFIDAVALLAAITFGIGILGFVIIILDAVLSWVTGGSFGRSLAVSKLIRAAETLAIIPISFFVVYVLNTLGIQEISSIAQVMDALLRRGWNIIIGILTKGG